MWHPPHGPAMGKVVWAASLAALASVAAVLVGGTYAADYKDPDPAGAEHMREFKQDVAQRLRHEGGDKKSPRRR